MIEREKEIGLSPEEKAELDHFVELEHILRMAQGASAVDSGTWRLRLGRAFGAR